MFLLLMECLGWVLVKFTAFEAFYETFGLVVSVAFRVFVVFMGHWSWTLTAFSQRQFGLRGFGDERFLWRLLCFCCYWSAWDGCLLSSQRLLRL